MSQYPELRPNLDDGIDRKVLRQLRQRFLEINAGRLQRALQLLSPRERLALHLLPLLLHINHPLLPGYLSAATPAGLSGFEPDDQLLAEAQRLARSFLYKPYRQHTDLPIHGLFLIGNLGSLLQKEHNALNLWVCHAATLDTDAYDKLRRKCTLLEQWAHSQDAKVHCFLVDTERFRDGEHSGSLTPENGNISRRYLLLDEFYRSSIWLAGRTPLWWLVPAYHEERYDEYCRILLGKRFIRSNEVLDFGHLTRTPAQEYISAGLRQLLKAIESPYESIFKLLLIESYASKHPRPYWLSLCFKERVFAGRLDLDELDPSLMAYHHLESYLRERNEMERLELLRRCLYLKVGHKLSAHQGQTSTGWQQRSLARIATEWNWEPQHFALLDSRSQWKARQVIQERNAVLNELTHSYRFLYQFVRRQNCNGSLANRDLSLLGRCLYTTFERKAGKIEYINPGIAPDLAEDELSLVHLPPDDTREQPQWALYNGSLVTQEWHHYVPLKRTRKLIELLAWCHHNGVIDSATRLSLHPGESDLGEYELNNLLASLRQILPMPLAPVGNVELLHPRRLKTVLLLINVGVDPLRHHSQMNMYIATERTDVLDYAGIHENLVVTLDQLSLNSWNELRVQRYEGSHALLDCLCNFLNATGEKPDAPPQPPQLTVRCFCRNRADTIAQRVEELFRDTYAQLLSDRPSRYLLQIRQGYHLLELIPGAVSYDSLPNRPNLLEHLGRERHGYSTLKLDRHALEGDDLGLILPLGRPNCIQVFYRRNLDDAEINVLDENNSLWQQRQPLSDEQTLLTPLQYFLQTLLYRHNALLPLGKQTISPEILYYELLPVGDSHVTSIERREKPEDPVTHPLYNFQALLERDERKRIQITLYYDNREFSELEYGTGLFKAVAQHILTHCQVEHCLYYLTDLDLSHLFADGQTQTLHYLRYKSVLETVLNQALTDE